MSSAVLLPLLLAVQGPPVPSDGPALRLDVWPRSFVRYGEPVEVIVNPERDGFLTVLRVDTHGRILVLFPLDPSDDAFVRAGEAVHLRSRYGTEAFVAFERDGRGTVLAALSDGPFDFRDYTAGGRWSYALLGVRYAGGDQRAALLDLVESMAGNERFEYAVVTYWVTTRPVGFYSGRYVGWPQCYGFAPGYAFGRFYYRFSQRGWWYGHAHYDPFSPFWYGDGAYDPACFDRLRYGFWLGGGTVIVPGKPGLPVDRGFKRKKDGGVKPLEPRRREPGVEIGIRRDIDLSLPKPGRRRDERPARDGSWTDRGRDRPGTRPGDPRMPEDPRIGGRDVPDRDVAQPRRREPDSHGGGGGGGGGGGVRRDREPGVQRPQPMRPERPSTPPPSRPAANRPAQRPAEKPKN